MKRIINGVTYNTETASLVARYEIFDHETGQYEVCEVYQTRGGAFFTTYTPPNGSRPYIQATDLEAVQELVSAQWLANLEIIDESVVNAPAEVEESPSATIYARVPAGLKRRLDEAARKEGQSVNAFVTRCLERCMGSSHPHS